MERRVGVFKKAYVEIIMAAHRILKPDRKFVLDIPNIVIRAVQVMIRIGEYHGKTGEFEMHILEFAELLRRYSALKRRTAKQCRNQYLRRKMMKAFGAFGALKSGQTAAKPLGTIIAGFKNSVFLPRY